VNFYANVRAANLKLPPEHRIKVWLGDPDSLSRRDDNFFRIISDEILKKQKKALLIIGTGHLFDPFGSGPGPLKVKIDEAYPHVLAVVSPFIGYIEPECNAKVVARAKDWPVPGVVGPVRGTWLESELQLPGCTYAQTVFYFGPGSKKPKKDMPTPGQPSGVQSFGPGKPPAQNEQIGKRGTTPGPPVGLQSFGPGKPPSLEGRMSAMLSGASSDAILYLGPPDTLTRSPIDPDIYLDPDYFNQVNRRLGGTLDWDQLLRENPVVPRKFEVPQ